MVSLKFLNCHRLRWCLKYWCLICVSIPPSQEAAWSAHDHKQSQMAPLWRSAQETLRSQKDQKGTEIPLQKHPLRCDHNDISGHPCFTLVVAFPRLCSLSLVLSLKLNLRGDGSLHYSPLNIFIFSFSDITVDKMCRLTATSLLSSGKTDM